MARLVLVTTGVLLLSLLAVASCRVLEADPETVVAISDEQQGQADPAVLQETDAAEAIQSVPTVTAAEAILRLPSHRRAWFLHRHLRSARHHGLSHRRSVFAGPGEARVVPASLLEEPREVKLEAVAEPDPDSRPEIDGEQKLFHGEEEEVEENESVKASKGEMLRTFRGHGLRFHHLHHHHEHAVVEKDDSDVQEQQNKEKGPGDMQLQHVRMFSGLIDLHHGDVEQEEQDKEEGVPIELLGRHFHHHDGEEEQDETARKHFFHQHHDSDNEVDEVEELARMLSKAIMRRSFRRGAILHHGHRAEESGVKKWFKGLMNRF